MPLIPDEAAAYGYVAEDRHMVESFRRGDLPAENWLDGLLVTRLMMTAYMSAESGKRIKFNPAKVRNYKPKVASGEWKPEH